MSVVTYRNVTVAPKVGFPDRLNRQTAVLAIGPGAIVKSWCDAGNPTVRVEKGYGSGVFQDLYPWIDRKLYTQPFGGGTEASVWAAGAKLLVEIPYNQCAADLITGHPTKLSADKRVLLDVSVTDAPFFAGYSTGTQDASQHATQRGYSITQTFQTNANPISFMALHQHAGGENFDAFQDTAGSPTRYWRLDGTLKRHFDSWLVAVATFNTHLAPNFCQTWALNDGRGIASEEDRRTGTGGVFAGDLFVAATSATSYSMNVMGPVNSLQGKLFALVMATATLTPSSMLFGGIPSRMASLSTKAVATDKPSIAFPYANATVPMNETTGMADIPVRLFGKPNTAYEANWQGGAYVTVGTTDANGILNGAMTGQSKGNGTFNVREVGGTTPIAISNVAVGFVWIVMGESDPTGRGDNVTHTIPTGFLRLNRANWTASSNEWWKLLAQKIYDRHGCVISVTKATAGGTLFLNGAQEGHWSVNNTANSPTLVAESVSRAISMQADFLTPNLVSFEIGKNDAASATSATNFTSRMNAFQDAFRDRIGNQNIKFHLFGIGPNAGTAVSATDVIRLETLSLPGRYPTRYSFAGSFAHLATTEVLGVHLQTQSEKQLAANVSDRTIYGTAGRGPVFSSISAPTSTTIAITLTGGVSPMTISASSDVTGWSVTDGSGTNAVTAVNVSGMVVTLTLTRARSGTSTVKWASGSTSIGTTLLDSASTTPLPPEPFQATI